MITSPITPEYIQELKKIAEHLGITTLTLVIGPSSFNILRKQVCYFPSQNVCIYGWTMPLMKDVEEKVGMKIKIDTDIIGCYIIGDNKIYQRTCRFKSNRRV